MATNEGKLGTFNELKQACVLVVVSCSLYSLNAKYLNMYSVPYTCIHNIML